jgi:signal transduction histidine kinase
VLNESIDRKSDLQTLPIRILAVDDREENLIALEAALQDQSYQLVKASSGREALRLIQEEEFALILLDVQMPEMDGFETARRIRSEPRSKTTPIIFVTAIYRTEEYEQRGYIAGAVDYLFKPIEVAILRAKVSVFADLYRKTHEIQRQAALLRDSMVRERENEFLKEAVRTRDEFLSIVSHELKTPITPLSLQLQSFRHFIETGSIQTISADRLKRMLDISYNQVERLSRLINDLLDLSRITAGRLSLNPEIEDLRVIVDSILEAFSDEFKKNHCEIVLQAPETLPGSWDRSRLEQVLINLLTNALKYGCGKPIEITLEQEGKCAKLKVRDHGIGIALEDQERIFQRFERAVPAEHYGGLGLGLYITQQIVALHQGRIHVESTPGEGATFTVELPVHTLVLN